MRLMHYLVDVADAQSRDTTRRRVAGLVDDETIAIATMMAGDRTAVGELEFSLSDMVRLSEGCLSGSQRALTTPGLARKLSATVAVLFRVAVAAGAITGEGPVFCEAGDDGGTDDHGDRDEADAIEDAPD